MAPLVTINEAGTPKKDPKKFSLLFLVVFVGYKTCLLDFVFLFSFVFKFPG